MSIADNNAPALGTPPACYTASMLRRLRIAASVIWLLMAVVLIGLSVWSSLSRFGVEYQTSSGDVNGISSEGENLFIFHSNSTDWLVLHPARAPLTGWFFHKFPRNPYPPKLTTKWSSKSFSLVVPYWIPTLFAVMVAAAPWVGFRFSLRTMLIATTLIAVIHGAARSHVQLIPTLRCSRGTGAT